MSGIVRQRNVLDVYHIPRSATIKDTFQAGVSDLRRLVIQNSTRAEAGGYLYTYGVNDVISWHWSKTTSTAGTLRIGLRPTKRYNEIIQPGDLLYVLTSSKYGAPGLLSLCLCLVDSVSESRSCSQGTTLFEYEVNARDFTKILLNTKTVVNPGFLAVNTVTQTLFNDALYNVLVKARSGSPCEIVLSILNVFYNGEGINADLVTKQWQTPDGFSLWSLVDLKRYVQVPMFGYNVPNPLDPAAYGTVWDMLRSQSNGVVNEMFIDMRDINPEQFTITRHQASVASAYLSEEDVRSQQAVCASVGSVFGDVVTSDEQISLRNVAISKSTVALIFRQYPYDRDAFDALPEVTVTAEETDTFTVSTSDHDVQNQFKIRTPALPQLEQEYLFGLVVNTQSQQCFGIREYDGETLYPFASSNMSLSYLRSTGQSIPLAVYEYYVGLLSVWHAYNERLLPGTWTGVYRPDIRVGMRFRFIAETDQHLRAGVKQRVFQAYIEGVQHSGNVEAGSGHTTVTFVRGIYTSDDNDPKKYENGLYWSTQGPKLRYNPYIIFNDKDFVGGQR